MVNFPKPLVKLLLLLAVCGAGYGYYQAHYVHFTDNMTFDQKIWLSDDSPRRGSDFNAYDRPFRRRFMIDDLRSKILRDGMRFEEVKRMLGKPKSEIAQALVYFTGFDGYKLCKLSISFNQDLKLQNFYHYCQSGSED